MLSDLSFPLLSNKRFRFIKTQNPAPSNMAKEKSNFKFALDTAMIWLM